MRRDIRVVTGLGVLIVGLVLASCTHAAEVPDQSDVDGVVVMIDIRYEPERLEVPRGQAVRLLLTNDGGIVHDLVFDGWESGEIRPGRSVVVELGPFEESFVAWCSVPGHRAAGMDLEIVVMS